MKLLGANYAYAIYIYAYILEYMKYMINMHCIICKCMICSHCICQVETLNARKQESKKNDFKVFFFKYFKSFQIWKVFSKILLKSWLHSISLLCSHRARSLNAGARVGNNREGNLYSSIPGMLEHFFGEHFSRKKSTKRYFRGD